MKHRGYELREETVRLPNGVRYDSVSVYDGEKRLAPTSTVAMARRVVDSWVARGRFATGETKTVDGVGGIAKTGE